MRHEQRIAAGKPLARVIGHVFLRSLSLIFIGLCMVNSCHGVDRFVVPDTGLSDSVWRLLMFVGVIGLWAHYPQPAGSRKWLSVAGRVAAAALLTYLLSIYQTIPDGSAIWLRPRWWGIIALIGWAYWISALVWLLCRDRVAALLLAFLLALAVNIGLRLGFFAGWESLVKSAGGWLPSLRLGAHASMAMAGMAVAALYHPRAATLSFRSRVRATLLFALVCALAGLLLRHPWGIHKSGGTPAWILLSLSFASALYALLHWLTDVKKFTRWSSLFALAGSNTLLMYMLPHIFYTALAALGIDFLHTHFTEGWAGVARSAVLALFLMAATCVLTRIGLRLKV